MLKVILKNDTSKDSGLVRTISFLEAHGITYLEVRTKREDNIILEVYSSSSLENKLLSLGALQVVEVKTVI